MCHKILQVTVTPVSGSERPLKSMGALGKKKKSTLVPKNLRANFVDFDHVRSPICHITSKGLHISEQKLARKNASALFFIGQ